MPGSPPFSISAEAKGRIVLLLDQYRERFGREAIPAVMWIDSVMNNGIIDSQPTIGFYGNIEDIKDEILTIDGLQLVLAVSDGDRDRFLGKTLNYTGEGFEIS